MKQLHKRRSSYSYGDITVREIIASIVIVCVSFIIGILITNKISEIRMDNAEKYNKALKIENDENMFKYALDTNVGYTLVTGDLVALDPVTNENIDGDYYAILEIRERYTEHTRTDSKGKTETYWTWDEIGRDTTTATDVNFLGVDFSADSFSVDTSDYVDTVSVGFFRRNKYYTYPTESNGTVLLQLKDNTIQNKGTTFNKDKNIDAVLKSVRSNMWLFIFWIPWIGVTGFIVYKFVKADNYWLNKN